MKQLNENIKTCLLLIITICVVIMTLKSCSNRDDSVSVTGLNNDVNNISISNSVVR